MTCVRRGGKPRRLLFAPHSVIIYKKERTETGITEEMPVRETVAHKRAPHTQNFIYGCIIAAPPVIAAASAVFKSNTAAGAAVIGVFRAMVDGGHSAFSLWLALSQM